MDKNLIITIWATSSFLLATGCQDQPRQTSPANPTVDREKSPSTARKTPSLQPVVPSRTHQQDPNREHYIELQEESQTNRWRKLQLSQPEQNENTKLETKDKIE